MLSTIVLRAIGNLGKVTPKSAATVVDVNAPLAVNIPPVPRTEEEELMSIDRPAPTSINKQSELRKASAQKKLGKLEVNPYAWEPASRIAKQVPLWMLYDLEREDIPVSSVIVEKDDEKVKRTDTLDVSLADPVTGRVQATGGRKTATATVVLKHGTGRFLVNGEDLCVHFPLMKHRFHVSQPLLATQTCGYFDIDARVRSGGLTGQAGAIRHATARALVQYDSSLKAPLRTFGDLYRDPRIVERKKPGQKKARKKFQWVKR